IAGSTRSTRFPMRPRRSSTSLNAKCHWSGPWEGLSMGERNSALTRVQPVFTCLLDRWPTGQTWVPTLWALAHETRPTSLERPLDLGKLVAPQVTRSAKRRTREGFEYPIAPSAAFLGWLLQNPARMRVRDPINFGTSDPVKREWRRKLISA